ncbi:sensor histidine kinase [Flavitalea flava]
MINKFIRFFIFTILSLSASPALAQSDLFNGYTVQHFNDESGLPQNSINDLLFDRSGFLWLASQVGLVRFDGNSFKLYTPDDKPAMEANLEFLGKDNKDTLYSQTVDHFLYRNAGRNGHLLSHVNTPLLKAAWLLNNRKQLFNFCHLLEDPAPVPESEKRKRIFGYLFLHNDQFFPVDSTHVYFIYGDTLYYFDNKHLQKSGAVNSSGPQCLVLNDWLYILYKNEVRSIYAAGIRIRGPEPVGGDLLAEPGTKEEEHNYRLFSGTFNHLLAGNRLYRISRRENGSLTTQYLLDLAFATNVSGVDYNPELDLLAVSTGTDGFYFFRRNRFRHSGFPISLQQALSQYLFGPLTLLSDSTIFTNRFVFDARGKFHLVEKGTSLSQKCLFADNNENIWTAVHDLPRKLAEDLKQVKVFPTLDAPIVDYAQDGEGNLYCLTQRSLWRLDKDSFRLLFNKEQLAPKGANECITLVSSRVFWIAGETGLIEYNLKDSRAKLVPDLSGKHVRTIHPCKDGSILLGTYGQGYTYYYRNRFFNMPLDKNRFLITSHCFLEDGKGDLWITCNKGLFKVPKADLDSWCDSSGHQLYYYYYGRQDGLPTNEFNGGFNSSGLITKNGFAVMLSMKGIICFYPDSLPAYFPGGNIDITNIEIDGSTGKKADLINLPSGYNTLLLEVSCPFLGNKNNLSLGYCLKGLNNEWKDVPEDGVINLSRLGPGNYTLRIRKVNGFGKDNYTYREWPLVVLPHFYQTSWFMLVFLLVLVLLLILLVQLRLTLIEKQKEIRSKAEKLKGTVVALEDTVKKLQESQKALKQINKVREKLISLVIHDLRSPLRFLTLFTSDLHDNQDKFSAVALKERTYLIKKGANDIYHFSEDFLLWVTSQKDNFSVSRRLFPIKPLLQEIHDFFREQVQQKGNRFDYEADEDLSIFSDPHILITIIRNLVDNANKYTDQGNIRVKAYGGEDCIIISVSDTGKGMSREQIEAFLQNENLEDVTSGTQLGHKFIFDLTRSINGTVSIESSPNEGTVIELRF